jgi:hypothetical protein
VRVDLYDGSPTRSYSSLRDAAWSLAIDHATAEYVDRIVKVLETCVATITNEGPDATLLRLQTSLEMDLGAPQGDAAVMVAPAPEA